MSSKILSVELHGLEGHLVEIEADHRSGLPFFTVVGLPDTAVQEARERVASAIKNSDFEFPRCKIIVNLAPADLRKVGPRYDLPIALGLLALTKEVPMDVFSDTIILGELALDGKLRPIHGILSSVEFTKKQNFKRIILPALNAAEASLIPGIEIIPASDLKEAVAHLKGLATALPIKPPTVSLGRTFTTDMSTIKGQSQAKRALEIAAAGGHNILLHGAPGAGKTLMARALSSILPSMSIEEMLEVSKLYSIAGLLQRKNPLITERPFRTVHHTASGISIVGGGTMPGPGEVSLSHRGVLFMDEIAEFPKKVLEVLRQPMEDCEITISRVKGTCTYPCKFTLVAAMNPCPCGYRNVTNAKKPCTCSVMEIRHYDRRLSGPLLDRIDMFVNVNPVEYSKLTSETKEESSVTIRKRVEAANLIQRNRFSGNTNNRNTCHPDQSKEISLTHQSTDTNTRCNAEMKNSEIEQFCVLDQSSKRLLETAMSQMNLSARGHFRILKLARTIADLENAPTVSAAHIAEALQYRNRFN